jgi:hypothetical protein
VVASQPKEMTLNNANNNQLTIVNQTLGVRLNTVSQQQKYSLSTLLHMQHEKVFCKAATVGVIIFDFYVMRCYPLFKCFFGLDGFGSIHNLLEMNVGNIRCMIHKHCSCICSKQWLAFILDTQLPGSLTIFNLSIWSTWAFCSFTIHTYGTLWYTDCCHHCISLCCCTINNCRWK